MYTDLPIILTLKQMPERVDIINRDNMMIIQQKIYLLQTLADMPLGYFFRWGISSPYSEGLTHELFCINTEYDLTSSEFENKSLRHMYAKFIEIINDDLIAAKPSDSNLSDLDWYKLISTVVYFSRHNDNFYTRYLEISKEIDFDYKYYCIIIDILIDIKNKIRNLHELWDYNNII